jgi:hypothetical protein
VSSYWTGAEDALTDLLIGQAAWHLLLGGMCDPGATASECSGTIGPGHHVAKQYEGI